MPEQDAFRYLDDLRALGQLQPTDSQVSRVVTAARRKQASPPPPARWNPWFRRRRALSFGVVAILALGGATAAALSGLADRDDPLAAPPSGTATDGRPVGVDSSGAYHLPPLTAATRPVIEGRSVEIPVALRRRADQASTTFEQCMLANGARRVRVDGVTGFDDPGLAKQRLCASELAASEAVGADLEYRIAQLAASAVRQDLWACLRRGGEANVLTASATLFDRCASAAIAGL